MNSSKQILRRGSLAIGAVCGAILAAPSFADPVLEEVVVTAQKREENLQKTPISLAAFGADAIAKAGITEISQIAQYVPNLRIYPHPTSPATLLIYLRGVGNFDTQITEDGPVGIYLNGVYIARNRGLNLDEADIERIEVLRGPQGTLYGRNTTGGAINIIIQKPTDKFGGSQMVGFGNYGAIRTQTVLNVPLSDTFFVKGAFDWNKRDGWIKNTSTGAAAGRDFEQFDKTSGRIDMRWLASDALTVDYSYDRAKDDYTGNFYQLIVPNAANSFLKPQRDRLSSAKLALPYKGDTDIAEGHTLALSLKTGWGELRSITAYRDVTSDIYNNYSANPTITYFVNDTLHVTQHQVSQEFQLLGSNDSHTFDYLAGLYYFKERGSEYEIDLFGLNGFGPIALAPRKDAAENRTYAAYAQLTFRPAADSPWSYTLGGRYTKDKRSANNFATGLVGVVPSNETSYGNFSPSLVVNYSLTDDINLYGKIVSGYKAGGFNLRSRDFSTPFGPEKLISYELGWKTEWLSHRLRWNNAIFYEDYKDIQLDLLVPNQPDPTLTETINGGKAAIAGIETELDFAVTDDFRLSGNYAHLYYDIKEVKNDNPDLWRLVQAPKNTVTASADWDFAHLSFGTLAFNADYSWRASTFTTPRRGPFDYGSTLPSYGLANARISLTGDDWVGKDTKFTVSAWVRNLADTKYYADTFASFSGIHANQVAIYGLPRTFGVDFKVKY